MRDFGDADSLELLSQVAAAGVLADRPVAAGVA